MDEEKLEFSKLYHNDSKDFRWIPDSAEDWPHEWGAIHYKTYPRLPLIELEDPKIESESLFKTLKNRHSTREKSGPITFSELSSLLHYSCGINAYGGEPTRRTYPSAGACYPIETYVLVMSAGAGLKEGLYHFAPKKNALHVLWDRHFEAEELKSLMLPAFSWGSRSSFFVFLTGTFWRAQNKYGERGYRYMLLEAGHIGQNLTLVSEALGISLCSFGAIYDKEVEKLLDIDGHTESLMYALVGGK